MISHCTELVARLRVAKIKPLIVCISEAFLDKSVKEVSIEGYSLIGRRDRCDGRKCGGVAVFAKKSMAESVTLLYKSSIHKRLWITVHSYLGPL